MSEKPELNALRQYAAEATAAITSLTPGGSEYFGRKIGDIYTADLPFCIRRIRERLESGHKAQLDLIKAERHAENLNEALRELLAFSGQHSAATSLPPNWRPTRWAIALAIIVGIAEVGLLAWWALG